MNKLKILKELVASEVQITNKGKKRIKSSFFSYTFLGEKYERIRNGRTPSQKKIRKRIF